jgi:hypothetical protein
VQSGALSIRQRRQSVVRADITGGQRAIVLWPHDRKGIPTCQAVSLHETHEPSRSPGSDKGHSVNFHAPRRPSTGATAPQRALRCIGSLSIYDSIARTATFAFADGGRIQRRCARTADPKLSQLKVNISPSKFSTKSCNIARASCPRIAVAL